MHDGSGGNKIHVVAICGYVPAFKYVILVIGTPINCTLFQDQQLAWNIWIPGVITLEAYNKCIAFRSRLCLGAPNNCRGFSQSQLNQNKSDAEA